MISETDKKIILDCAKKYNVKEIILFGSSIEKEDANDIDIGVKGIKPDLFFKFYGELLSTLSKLIDIVDLDEENSFNKLVERDGVKLYG